jgi:hypothetical protein
MSLVLIKKIWACEIYCLILVGMPSIAPAEEDLKISEQIGKITF